VAANLQKCPHFRERPKFPARDPCGWLGIEDSNRDVSNSSGSLQSSAPPVGASKSDLRGTGDYERGCGGARATFALGLTRIGS
jgi:hypothetical protein